MARWRARLVLPFSLITAKGEVSLRTEDAVAQNFGLYLKAMEVMGLDMVVRRPRELVDCGDGTWLGTYRTDLLARSVPVTAGYTATALLEHGADGPVARSVLGARGHSDWTGVLPPQG